MSSRRFKITSKSNPWRMGYCDNAGTASITGKNCRCSSLFQQAHVSGPSPIQWLWCRCYQMHKGGFKKSKIITFWQQGTVKSLVQYLHNAGWNWNMCICCKHRLPMLFKSVIFNEAFIKDIKAVPYHHQMLHSDNWVPRYCAYTSHS